MDVQGFHFTDWVRAATLAHMVLSQALSDEALGELVVSNRPAGQVVVPTLRAA